MNAIGLTLFALLLLAFAVMALGGIPANIRAHHKGMQGIETSLVEWNKSHPRRYPTEPNKPDGIPAGTELLKGKKK